MGGPTSALPLTGLLDNRYRTVGRQKDVVYQLLGACRYPSVMENKFFRGALIAKLLKTASEFPEGFVPTDFPPLPLASFTVPFERCNNTVRIVQFRRSTLAFRTYLALVSDGIRLAFYLDNAALIDVTNNSAAAGALPTDAGIAFNFAPLRWE